MTEKVEFWLERNKVSLVKDFRFEVRKFLDKIKRYNKMTCKDCRFETETAVCANCFTRQIVNWMKKADDELAIDFTKNFRYEQVSGRDLYA